jgi:RNA-binding protein
MLTISAAERRALRAKAHHLHPVVSVGQHGLTPAVLHEIDVNLMAHELIKVKVFSDARDERDTLLERICMELDAAPVQHIGKLFVLWRPAPDEEPVKKAARPMSRPRPRDKVIAAEPRTAAKAKRVRTLPTGKSAPMARRPREPSARVGMRNATAGAATKASAPRDPSATRAPHAAVGKAPRHSASVPAVASRRRRRTP